jgi:predicted transcriptional regulator/phage head maturation protease
MAKPLHFYGEISRVDEEARMVWGYASTTALAEDGQTITIGALEDALDEYMRFANIREMHQQVAVGVAREASVDEKGMYLGAHVVDDAAWMKVKTGVYKGFSIKGPVTKRDPVQRSSVTGLKIYEISLVDRPSDPDAVFDVWRSADADPTADEPAAEAAEEEDMSRAARQAQPAQAAAPETQMEVERAPAAADTAAPAEAGEGEDPGTEASPDDEAQRAAEGSEAPAPDADPVAEAVAGATAAMGALDEAVLRATGGVVVDVSDLPGAELRRSLGLVNRLGYVLNELAYVIYEADYEKEVEGDDSPVPMQLREAMRGLAVAYKTMSAEEVDELLANTKVEAAVERGVVALALGADLLERSADVEISADTAGQLQTLFDAFVARGWAPVLPQPEEPDELQREIAGLKTDRDTLIRTVDDMTGRMTEMAEAISRMSEAVLPPKTGGSLARAVDKTEDAQGAAAAPAGPGLSEDEVRRTLDAMPENERALLLTRAALARPIAISPRSVAPAA